MRRTTAQRELLANIAAAHGVTLAFAGQFVETPGVIEWVARDGSARAIPPGGYDHFGPDAALPDGD